MVVPNAEVDAVTIPVFGSTVATAVFKENQCAPVLRMPWVAPRKLTRST